MQILPTNKLVNFLALFCSSGVLLLTLVFPLTTTAAFTKQINYQGKLTNASSASVPDGNYSIVFKLYDASTGGNTVWIETQPTVTVTSGLFSTMLGSVATLDNVNFNQALYLGINVNGDGEMTPRKTIGSVPSALYLKGNASSTAIDVSGYLTVSGVTTLATTTMSFNPTRTSAISFLNNSSFGADLPYIKFDSGDISGSTGFTSRHLGAMEDSLALVASENNPGLIFLDISGSPTLASVSYATTTKILEFSAPGGFSFDNDISVGIGTGTPMSMLSVVGNSYFNGNSTTTGFVTLATTTISQLKIGDQTGMSSLGSSMKIGGTSEYIKTSGGSDWYDLGLGSLVGFGNNFSQSFVTATSTGGEANAYWGNLNKTTYKNTLELTYGLSNQLNTVIDSSAKITGQISNAYFSMENQGIITGNLVNLNLDNTPGGTLSGDYIALNIGAAGNMGGVNNYAIKTGTGLVSFGGDVVIETGSGLTLNGVKHTSWPGGTSGTDVNWTHNPLTDILTLATSTSGILVNGTSTFSGSVLLNGNGVVNSVSGLYKSFILGGSGNVAFSSSPNGAVIVGGLSNYAESDSYIFASDNATATTGVIIGSSYSSTTNVNSVGSSGRRLIIGGSNNFNEVGNSIVAGGHDNRITGAQNSIGIFAGENNTASGWRSVITGGSYNQALGIGSGVYSGSLNVASGTFSSVLGGDSNFANGINSVILGGHDSTTTDTALYSAIIGGEYNKISGSHSLSLDGVNNLISGNYSYNIGGSNNIVSGSNSYAFGTDINIGGAYSYGFGRNIVSDGHNSMIFSLDSVTYYASSSNVLAIMGGRVGIGTTSPLYALDVVGVAGNGNYVARFQNSALGTSCTLSGVDGTISCTSDERLKKNITTLSDPLTKVLALNPVSFNWNKDQNNLYKNYGFLAQQVETVIPELVSTNSDGYKSLAMNNMIPFLAGAIQQQQAQIDLLRGLSIDASGNLVVKSVSADKLCLGTTCITEPELKTLLDKAQLLPISTPSTPPILPDDPTSTSTDNSSSTTPEVVADPIPSVDSPAETPVPLAEPSISSEPSTP